jgi:hypothetical protein
VKLTNVKFNENLLDVLELLHAEKRTYGREDGQTDIDANRSTVASLSTQSALKLKNNIDCPIYDSFSTAEVTQRHMRCDNNTLQVVRI